MTSFTRESNQSSLEDHEGSSALKERLDTIEIDSSHAQWAWLKMDLTILPIISMFYFLSFLVSAVFHLFEWTDRTERDSVDLLPGSFQYRKRARSWLGEGASHD